MAVADGDEDAGNDEGRHDKDADAEPEGQGLFCAVAVPGEQDTCRRDNGWMHG